MILSILAAALLGLFLPTPVPALKTGQLWSDTRVLEGREPLAQTSMRGSSYSPIGLVFLAALGGPDWTSNPSGSQATRSFEFPDERSARAAANEAIALAIRDGYEMQSAQSDSKVWQQGEGQWGDDGWKGSVRFEVTLTSPENPYALSAGWSVQLRLEHAY